MRHHLPYTNHRGGSPNIKIEDQIIEILKTEDRTFSPSEIAKKGHLNPNTTRSRISLMLKQGKIRRLYYGAYQLTPTYGVGEVRPVRVQNLAVIAEDVNLAHLGEGILRAAGYVFRYKEGWVYSFEFGRDFESKFRLRVQLGLKRGKVTWTVKAPWGLEIYGFRLCKKVVEDNLARLGVVFVDFDRSFMVNRSEFLNDYVGVDISGFKSVTVYDFEGQLEKIYEKAYGIRREVRVSRPMPIENVLALVSGGLSHSQVISGVGLVHQDIGLLVDAVKGQNRMISNLTRVVSALTDSHIKFKESATDLLNKLGENL